MSTAANRRRIEQLKASLPVPEEPGASLYSIHPQSWPPDAMRAYEQAKEAGDLERQFQVIEQETGVRMRRNPPGQVIEFRVRTDGPW